MEAVPRTAEGADSTDEHEFVSIRIWYPINCNPTDDVIENVDILEGSCLNDLFMNESLQKRTKSKDIKEPKVWKKGFISLRNSSTGDVVAVGPFIAYEVDPPLNIKPVQDTNAKLLSKEALRAKAVGLLDEIHATGAILIDGQEQVLVKDGDVSIVGITFYPGEVTEVIKAQDRMAIEKLIR